MNLCNVNGFQRMDSRGLAVVNGRTWYRAVAAAFAKSPLHYSHTFSKASRFNTGTGIYPMLYLAPDPLTAMLEFRALARVPNVSGLLVIKPAYAYAVLWCRRVAAARC